MYGVLEDHYRDDMTVDEGIDLAIRALSSAMKRDSASGDGMDIAVITKEGFRLLSDEEIEERKKKLNIN